MKCVLGSCRKLLAKYVSCFRTSSDLTRNAPLTVWCEDLGRLLLLRDQKNCERGDFTDLSLDYQHKLKSLSSHKQSDTTTMATMGWQQTPPAGYGPHHQAPQQHLSVVTTVWGVTTSTQSGPLAHNSYTGTNTSMAQVPYGQSQHAFPGSNPTGMSSKVYPPQGMTGRPAAQGYNGYDLTSTSMGGSMMVPGNGPSGDYQNPSGALNAAALVARAAAAATATATATASVVAFQEQQQEAVMGNQFNSQLPSVKEQHQYRDSYGAQHLPHGLGQVENHMNNPMAGTMTSMDASLGIMNNPMMNSANSMNRYNSENVMNGPVTMNVQMNKAGMQVLSRMGSGGTAMYQGPPVGMSPQPRSRVTPYPSPAQYLAEKRQSQYSNTMISQYSSNMPPYGASTQQSYSPSQYSIGQSTQFGKQPHQYPSSLTQPISSMAYPPHQTMRPSMRPQGPSYMAQQGQYYPSGQVNGTTPQLQHEQPYNGNTYVNPPNYQRSFSYQQPSVPGNPTPPLTPASGLTPYIASSHGDVKPMVHQGKDAELRLTFPVRDGTILPPFRLEHNLAVSNHFFQLKPSIHQTLVMRSDLELQLKCFHHEDRQMNTNWPTSVQVSVNAVPITIDRGETKTSHRPLYLKEVCHPGRNTIQITVTACCCSHLFLLQLVHRPTVKSVLQGLLRKRLLPAEHCVSKIKRNFNSVATTSGDGVEQTAIKVSLKCPITFKKINLPARGEECKHIQCFDLQSYLQLNSERESWRCPVCSKTAVLEKLEVDQYMWAVLNNLSKSEVEEITIDALASWKPVSIKPVKEEHEQDACGGHKWFKAMSPGSMTLPTSNSWEVGQAMSPYSAVVQPDMNSIANGQVLNGSSYRGLNGNYDFPPDFNSPLSHLSESVTSLDPLTAMEKSLNHHEQQMCHAGNIQDQTVQHHTPLSSVPSITTQSQQSSDHSQNPPSTSLSSQNQELLQHGPKNGGTLSAPSSSVCNNNNGNLQLSCNGSNNHFNRSSSVNNSLSDAPDLCDLNIASIFDSDSQGPDGDDQSQESLNLLPETVVDPMELLSYLEPPELCSSSGNSCTTSRSTTSTTASNSGDTISTSNSTSEDILALFDT
ncbi:zinc finger MIZ domain-containing protein 1-like isoform X3 [Tachypleus tridentatus]|uniref:zinc finger MIZ domain-containing protein 1-like isoform X3 n=1 Tax=Tachypleus tridentatus TaxID=6853 RepID=UPI003FCFEE93